MANNRDDCDSCCGIVELARNNETFKWAVLKSLCSIINGGGGVTSNVNITSVGATAVTLGQKTMAASFPVVIASNQSALPVTLTAASGTPTTTTPTMATATSVTILAANAARKYLLIQNNSAASIGISLSGAALTGITPTSTNKSVVIVAGGYYEMPPSYNITGAITAYQASGGSINTVTVVEG